MYRSYKKCRVFEQTYLFSKFSVGHLLPSTTPLISTTKPNTYAAFGNTSQTKEHSLLMIHTNLLSVTHL